MSFLNKVLFTFVALFAAYSLTGCDSLMGSPLANDVPKQMDGFVYIKSAGRSVFLGTNDSTAPVKERPEMKVDFTYDFFIGKTEVVCQDYNRLMSRFGYVYPCDNENYPVADLTFYDAVLYANALSKQSHMDTAYSYISATFDEEGHCIDLEGYKFKPEVEAYRLPTEAEWIYAASSDWNLVHEWTYEVSDYIHHGVGLRRPNGNGLYDMGGNVTEFVNDWFSYFQDTTLTNFVGGTNGGSFGERIVKGGNFYKLANNTSLYSRSEVYIVTSSTKSMHVGMRLAYGAIPEATWMSSGGVTGENSSTILSNSTKVKSETDSYRTKLAFRNDVTGNLDFIDYSFGALQIVEIPDTLNVFHPDISPDGKKVAFCTNMEGLKGESAVYVRDLNETGSNLVKLDVESAVIPRWRVLPDGDTVIVYVTSAYDNSSEESFKSTSTWQVPFSNGTFGIPEKLFDGAYHGGVSNDDRLAVSGSKLLRARIDDIDTVWMDGNQICNVSLSGGADKKTLYLDFAGSQGKEFVGSSYGVHEMLFVADSNGKILKAVPAPDGYTFDHSEWAHSGDSQKNIAVASLTNENGAHSKLVLVNLSDSSIVELVEGDELWHPCLWIKPKTSSSATDDVLLSLDSLGIYYDNSLVVSEEIMKPKMRMFWEMRDSLDLIAVGSSRMERGFNPLKLSSLVSLNMGYSGNELWGELYFVENYILNHVKDLKYLLIEMPLDLQNNSPTFKNSTLFKQAPGYIYDAEHDFWKEALPEEFMAQVKEFQEYTAEEDSLYVKTLGLLHLESAGWKSNEVDRDSVFTDEERGYYDDVMEQLDDFIDSTENMGFKIILVIYPQAPSYAKTGAFGRHGLQRSLAMETIEHYRQMTKKYSHLYLMDENNMGDHEYTDDMASDYDHLCTKGADHFTEKLDSLIKTMD